MSARQPRPGRPAGPRPTAPEGRVPRVSRLMALALRLAAVKVERL
jgi:hypothetical protein